MDRLIICDRCGSNACYEQHINEELVTKLCMGCGFTTSTYMTEGSQAVNQLIETSAELYKDLLFKDENGFIWAPSVITLPEKGIVFIDGRTAEDWKWAAAKMVAILKEEQSKFPKGQTHKVDMESIQHYGQGDFMDAMEYIGAYAI